jgi:hypothetical protein
LYVLRRARQTRQRRSNIARRQRPTPPPKPINNDDVRACPLRARARKFVQRGAFRAQAVEEEVEAGCEFEEVSRHVGVTGFV